MRYIILLIVFFSFLDAHKINLFISEEDGQLDIYSYFANAKPCVNCQLIIKDENKIILNTKLDEKGKYLYTPKVQNLEVIVDATSGHRVSQELKLQEIKKELLQEHIKKEQSKEYLNIFIGLVLLFLLFFILKKIKKK